jgi:hypothetical protein
MLEISREIFKHKQHIIPTAKLVRQKKRNMGPERQKAAELKVGKTIAGEFHSRSQVSRMALEYYLSEKSNGE